MTAAPWMKYYPADWRSEQTLRVCGLSARGLWQEMLCLMHTAEPRGSLLVNGLKVTEKQLATLAGCSVREVIKLTEELETAGVFSRDEDGTIYSRRMRRDEVKAAKDKANGSRGGSPILKGVNPPDNGQDKAHMPEARVQTIHEIDSTKHARPFPETGSIAYVEPYATIARAHGRGADVDVLAIAYRAFCQKRGIAWNDRNHPKIFGTFAKQHKVAGLHS